MRIPFSGPSRLEAMNSLTIDPGDGAMMYFVPPASGYRKFHNSPLNTFWCCTGTGAGE